MTELASPAQPRSLTIPWNRVSIRFATYTAGCVTLAVMWARFAASVP
jgi:hypothetical protein